MKALLLIIAVILATALLFFGGQIQGSQSHTTIEQSRQQIDQTLGSSQRETTEAIEAPMMALQVSPGDEVEDTTKAHKKTLPRKLIEIEVKRNMTSEDVFAAAAVARKEIDHLKLMLN